MNTSQEIQLIDLVRMINLNRHDWLNHIQVIHGYLSLQQYDKVQDYIHQITLQLQNEHHLSRLGHTELVLDLFTYPARYPQISFEVEMIDPICIKKAGITEEMIMILRNTLNLIGQFVRLDREESPSLVLRIEKHDELIYFTFDLIGELDWSRMSEIWHELMKTFDAFRVKGVERVKNENEWVLDLIMG